MDKGRISQGRIRSLRTQTFQEFCDSVKCISLSLSLGRARAACGWGSGLECGGTPQDPLSLMWVTLLRIYPVPGLSEESHWHRHGLR